MTIKNIAIIGAGNMGMCLLGGLIATGYPTDKLKVAEPSLEKINYLKQQFNNNIHFTTNNSEAIETADIIIFAVKPLILPTILRELANTIQNNHSLVISVAAGVTVKAIQDCLGEKTAIIRTMPNTPALIRCGITALFANTAVTAAQKNAAESILRAIGSIVWIENESLMSVITALSGSGPAYFFLIIEALQQAGEKLGLTPEVARLLTLETAYGATRMALESDKNVVELRKQVTSPGGTTEQAIRVLEEANIRDIFTHAIEAANHRSHELAEMITKKTEA